MGPELLVPYEEHVQCDHRFASQPLANEPLHSSQLFDTIFRKRAAQLHYVGPALRYIFWPPKEARKCSEHVLNMFFIRNNFPAYED